MLVVFFLIDHRTARLDTDLYPPRTKNPAFFAPQAFTALDHEGIGCTFFALPVVANFLLDEAYTKAVSARWNPHATTSLLVNDWADSLSVLAQDMKGSDGELEPTCITMVTPQTLAFHPIDQVKALFLDSEPVTVVEVCMVEYRNGQGKNEKRYYHRTLQNDGNEQTLATEISARSSAVDVVTSHIASCLRDQRQALMTFHARKDDVSRCHAGSSKIYCMIQTSAGTCTEAQTFPDFLHRFAL